MEDLDQIIKEIRENSYDNVLANKYKRKPLDRVKNMINFPIFIEGLLMPLLGLGVFFIHKRSKRKKRKFHAPPTYQLSFK